MGTGVVFEGLGSFAGFRMGETKLPPGPAGAAHGVGSGEGGAMSVDGGEQSGQEDRGRIGRVFHGKRKMEEEGLTDGR